MISGRMRCVVPAARVLLFGAAVACAAAPTPPVGQSAAATTPALAPPVSRTMTAPSATSSATDGTVSVLLCDGQTSVRVPQGTPGTSIAGALMQQWLQRNPNSNWETEERERHTLQLAADNADVVGHQRVQGQTYGTISSQDVALWKSETERMALAGSEVFHNADELGSTVGVSCDMCHPHAANTHPETYPKFQAQLGRVSLLRDMINWCIEHPVRGKPLASDDPRMRALEAYILAQRKGTALAYGRH
jgi:thiosulfate dehydrogenase